MAILSPSILAADFANLERDIHDIEAPYVPEGKKPLVLSVDDVNYYEVSGGSYPIIIKDSDKYGIEFNNNLVYVNITDVKEVVESNNTNQEIASDVSVLNYHFVVDREEMKSCAQSICLRDENFDSQIKYLKDNSYYAVSLRDLELNKTLEEIYTLV